MYAVDPVEVHRGKKKKTVEVNSQKQEGRITDATNTTSGRKETVFGPMSP